MPLGLAVIVALAFSMTMSCVTTVPQSKIQLCRLFCGTKKGIFEIRIDWLKGVGCHCRSGEILWLDIQEDGPFQDNKPIDQDSGYDFPNEKNSR